MSPKTVLVQVLLTCIFSQTTEFDLRSVHWDHVRPDISVLHRLRAAQHDVNRPPLRTVLGPAAYGRHGEDLDTPMVLVQTGGGGRLDFDSRLQALLKDLQSCNPPLDCTLQREDADLVMSLLSQQETKGRLFSASELSYSYTHKLLVMADDDKWTQDRVQEEYRSDPDYSLVVTTACLHNASCLPAAHGRTVVKIFGKVSEDGQAVSGYSGSALADLLSKPSLREAPLISLDGNTATAFQQDFLRTCVHQGIEAVLETSHRDQHTYQALDKEGSVIQHQSEKRPVDHSTEYDKQHILIMQDDPVVRQAAMFLYEKHPAVSSVYVLDEHQRPKLIHGDSTRLSADSRLALVGHGKRDEAGEMRLAGFTATQAAEISARMPRDGDQIKTINVVACEIGSDKIFLETYLRVLLEKFNVKTELHVKNTILQVSHTGQKITQEITPNGPEWRHKDSSKTVVATLDKNRDVVIRDQSSSTGEAIFTSEENELGPQNVNKKVNPSLQKFKTSWPNEPTTFIDRVVLQELGNVEKSCNELEALTWAIFHCEEDYSPSKTKILSNIKNNYVIGHKTDDRIDWITEEEELKDVLSNCYEIQSGEDVLNIIHHFAKTGEDNPTYLMVNEWIYVVDPQNLYVYPVGKKRNEENPENNDDVQTAISEQVGKHAYKDIKGAIKNSKKDYVEYVRETFIGNQRKRPLSLSTEAWYNTHFTASIISESSRNFRTFPLILMALDMSQSSDNNIQDIGQDFIFDNSMTAGGSWIDPSSRGFTGSSTPKGSSKLKKEDKLMNDLKTLIKKEYTFFTSWSYQNPDITEPFINVAVKYLVISPGSPNGGPRRDNDQSGGWKDDVLEGGEGSDTIGGAGPDTLHREDVLIPDPRADLVDSGPGTDNVLATTKQDHKTGQDKFKTYVKEQYNNFKNAINKQPAPSTSGPLGGSSDGSVAVQDLHSAAEAENSIRLESYWSRASAVFTDQIHSQLKETFGEKLAELHLKEGSEKMEHGQFTSQITTSDNSKVIDFKVELHPEGQRYHKQMLSSIEKAVNSLDVPSPDSSHTMEKAGSAVGTLGLLLGMQGAVQAFEQGDIKDGVIGALQTAHGVSGMTLAAIGKAAGALEGRSAKTIVKIMRSSPMKAMTGAIPIVGIGFGIYNIKEDFTRHDTLGYIDAGVDIVTVGLDFIELAQPELIPFIEPVNLALSVIRMVSDDIYMGIQDELNSLPENAGILEKLLSVEFGIVKGLVHFENNIKTILYNSHDEEVSEGLQYVERISDHHKYYSIIKEQNRITAIDFTHGESSWNGGGICFNLADEGQSKLCMDYFVSSDNTPHKECWLIDTEGSEDIILGIGESHQLEHTTFTKKVLMFIPAGHVTVASGYQELSNSRYGTYKGSRKANRFFAVQKAEDKHAIEVMLSYYYHLYGELGNDMFFLGPQRSFVMGAAGQDIYIIPEDGGKTIINNYDPSMSMDMLHFSVDYSQISVSKSGDDVVLLYCNSHTVTIQNWFLGEAYRHMNLMSADGVLFEVFSTVISSVQLVARGINKMSSDHGETVDTTQPLLRMVTNICGSPHDDTLIGNRERNVIDGGGGYDRLIGGGGEDTYLVKSRAVIENLSPDNATDITIVEAKISAFRARVEGDHLVLIFHDDLMPPTQTHSSEVTLLSWFCSEAHRHMVFISKDFVTFTVSDIKADCQLTDPFTKCIRSHNIDYSSSDSALHVDLENVEVYNSVTEVRGSPLNDVIKGSKSHNTILPGKGDDVLQGRGGEDWYVIMAGQGFKTINNQSPDLATDIVFLKERYEDVSCACEGLDIILSVSGRRTICLQDWFKSRYFQHLQIQTADGATFGLVSNASSCSGPLMVPQKVDFRQSKTAQVIDMDNPHFASVVEMYGSSSLDHMMGNKNDNLLDPYIGGAVMSGGEGKDTYIVKRTYSNLKINNFAEDELVDTVLVDMDFLSGSEITFESPLWLWSVQAFDIERMKRSVQPFDIIMNIYTRGEIIQLTLSNHRWDRKYQHLTFQTSDGVYFNLKYPPVNGPGGVILPTCEAYKVAMRETGADCHLDLTSQRNLSSVLTVQGCPSLSNHIQGNDRDNVLIGGWKDDVLEGGEGSDTLIGGAGSDVLMGGLGDDTLRGEDGSDTMMGDSGRDVLVPGPGADLVDGGPGRDTVLYRGDHATGQGVYVNLLSGVGRQADAEGDVLMDVENVIGTIYSDILVSGYEPAMLKGSDGNDILVSVGAGDHLVGGEGRDVYLLMATQGSITIDNCAKDKAGDVLYLTSLSTGYYTFKYTDDGLLMTYYGADEHRVEIKLLGVNGSSTECTQLTLVFAAGEITLDELRPDYTIEHHRPLHITCRRFSQLIRKSLPDCARPIRIVCPRVNARLFGHHYPRRPMRYTGPPLFHC